MANEITTQILLHVAKGSLDLQRFVSKSITQTGTGWNYSIQNVGTTYEAISLGDVTTAGMMYAQNLDPTNYVEIGVVAASTFYPTVKIKAGESAMFRAGTNSLYAKANTAAVNVEMWVVQD